jgi:two-component system nitrogen regulation response regulator NtrX
MAHEVLIVDDEADIRMMITGILEDEGYACRSAATSEAALEAVRTRVPMVVLLDIWLANSAMDGLELLQALKAEVPDLPVIMISGHGTIESAVWAIQQGAYDFIEKPFKTDRVLLCVERAVETSQLKRENQELRLRAGEESELVGVSPATQHLRQSVQKVAPTGSRVLISGPPGSGKDVVARMLHRESRRAAQPFVVLNCAIMHPERLESELFGIDTAEERRPGTFERAHGGTLVLDEVADMPLETQGKIVRVLQGQGQSFARVGGSSRIDVDVRVMATTNRDLYTLMQTGQFREDLYYRLNVVPLQVAPLSERREDIPTFVEHFVARAAQNAGMPPRRLSEDALTALQAYDWPGNVRQLRNVIDWLLIMAPGHPEEPIPADMLPSEIGSSAPAVLRRDGQDEIMALPLREARELFERQYLEAQVMRFGGNISRTAHFVGMERSALHRKLRSLGISSAADRQ